MAKHVIFLVHGMGDTTMGWSAPLQKAIKEKYQLYRVASRKRFEATFQFKELNYNYVFQSHIDKWQENAASVTNLLQASGIDNASLNYLNQFSSKAARKEFASTHILDVILYRFMKGIKSQVIAHLSEQMVGKLNESSTVPNWSIVCHSLGTAVMHDVMQANMTTDHYPLATAHGVAKVYMTIANVSKVLEDSDTNVYTSAVRPELADRNKPFSCRQFINISHSLDPFTKVNPFKPKWKKGARKPLNDLRTESYGNIKISGLTGWNPHDFGHYIDNPGTHVALFRGLLTQGSISEVELQKQKTLFKQRTLSGQFSAVKNAVDTIRLDDRSTFSEAVIQWTKFQQSIQLLIDQARQ